VEEAAASVASDPAASVAAVAVTEAAEAAPGAVVWAADAAVVEGFDQTRLRVWRVALAR
jgi:hypothetical protein